MRPEILNPIFSDVTILQGVGPRIAAFLQKIAGPLVVDLIFTPPVGLVDRSHCPGTAHAEQGERASFLVTIDSHVPPPKGRARQPYKIICSDEEGFLVLVFFHAKKEWIEKNFPLGAKRFVSGKVERYAGELQMAHPELVHDPDSDEPLPMVEPVYPLTAGLSSRQMLKIMGAALARLPDLPEWHRKDVLEKYQWPTWKDSLKNIHHPKTNLDLNMQSLPRQRLAYDELLANQIALALIRARGRQLPGRIIKGDGSLREKVLGSLPFSLTKAQETALAEIYADMAAPSRMVRLLQGDVGSGKTIVALLAMLAAIEESAQAAMIAPTEILARQHYESLKPFCEKAGITIELLTGRDKGQQRQAKLRGIEAGYINIIVGTHALFSEDVVYHDLALIVVDEQHRFGVQQRLALQDKGNRADLLVTTATPIPRTLALTVFGDMEISRITEKPPGRKIVDTRAVPLVRLPEVIEGIGRAIARGEQVYWVCPLVEESFMLDLTPAEDRYQLLHEKFGNQVGLVHGKMKGPEKDAIVEAFYRGDLKVLVATTVIEVGVNAPDATIMVIEHAERFGLAQLHQLRGRVGRSDKQSTCILLYKPDESGALSKTAKARLNILRETDDGFLIAEEDLRLRGAGDALGTSQSGFASYRMADLAEHGALLEMASQDAKMIVEQDPELKTERGEALRVLLYLFGRDAAVKRLRSG